MEEPASSVVKKATSPENVPKVVAANAHLRLALTVERKATRSKTAPTTQSQEQILAPASSAVRRVTSIVTALTPPILTSQQDHSLESAVGVAKSVTCRGTARSDNPQEEVAAAVLVSSAVKKATCLGSALRVASQTEAVEVAPASNVERKVI